MESRGEMEGDESINVCACVTAALTTSGSTVSSSLMPVSHGTYVRRLDEAALNDSLS